MPCVAFITLIMGVIVPVAAHAVPPDQKTLPVGWAPGELARRVDEPEPAPETAPPTAPVHSLGEWEAADAAMTLWPNPSFVRALAARGPVRLIADTEVDKRWWADWLRDHDIGAERVAYFVVPTDSIWIRDYGPWFIVDGEGRFGLVDTKYNRPRPRDDLVPEFLARTLGIPMYQPGLTHTGGNYYSDGLGNGFSSTLVYSENDALSRPEVDRRMRDHLGIERYATSPLAPGITIEHLDTFGKLVAPDTWVWSDFPTGSRYRADSERMLALIRTLKSPYGTPYKIFRLRMTPDLRAGRGEFRAYINSFISNRALYYPAYGDAADATTAAVYQAALPGYEIVPVDAEGTSWGDSVHCRSRNLLTAQAVFVFPYVSGLPAIAGREIEVLADVIPAPGAALAEAPVVTWSTDGGAWSATPMTPVAGWRHRATLPPQPSGRHVALVVTARDSLGHTRTAPIGAPAMTIEFTVP